MFGQLIPLARGFITITPDSERAMTSQNLADYLHSLGLEATACATDQEGLDTALKLAGEDDVICVCGSLYMIGAVRHLLGLC